MRNKFLTTFFFLVGAVGVAACFAAFKDDTDAQLEDQSGFAEEIHALAYAHRMVTKKVISGVYEYPVDLENEKVRDDLEFYRIEYFYNQDS